MTIAHAECREAPLLHSNQLVRHALPTTARSPWLASHLWGCPAMHPVARLAGHASIDHRGCLGRQWQCRTEGPELTVVTTRLWDKNESPPTKGLCSRLAHNRGSVAVSHKFSESMPAVWTTGVAIRPSNPGGQTLSRSTGILDNLAHSVVAGSGQHAPDPVLHQTLLRVC